MSLTLSFRMFGNLLKRSAKVTIMFAFTPNSIFDCTSSNSKSRFSAQIKEDTHMNLHRARIADLSRIHKLGLFNIDSFEL